MGALLALMIKKRRDDDLIDIFDCDFDDDFGDDFYDDACDFDDDFGDDFYDDANVVWYCMLIVVILLIFFGALWLIL